MSGEAWSVAAEFLVSAPTGTGWELCCAECLPILVRRSFRRKIMPTIGRSFSGACQVRDPHPPPGKGFHVDGSTCPRPLTGPCMDVTCGHD